MIKMLYLHILQADSTKNLNAFCKLIVLDNYKISKKSKKSVLRYIENFTGSVGNFVKCIWVIIKKWRNLCPIRFSRIRNFNFLVFLSIILIGVMCNTNKTLSNVSGDVV